jgi:hypothetical protein
MTIDHANSNEDPWDEVVELTEHAIELRQQMAMQLSQVIIRTNAVWLDPEVLVGALLEAFEETDPANTARRKSRGDTYLSSLSRRGERDPQLPERDGT